jgi:TRAP-type uncharacterized transport system fused permease subunit
MTSSKSRFLTVTSFACALHCLIAPFLIIVAPSIGSFFHNTFIEFAILGLSILTGTIIIYKGYCTHKKKHAASLFIIGIGVWLLHALWEYLFDYHGHAIFLIIGTIFILISYQINHRHMAPPCCTHHHH